MKRLPFVLCLLFSLAMLTGCLGNVNTPPLVQIYSTKQAYTESLRVLTAEINAGHLDDEKTLKAIVQIRGEIETGIAEAEKKARAGDKIGYQFVIERVNSLLTRYLELQKPVSHGPTSYWESSPWESQKSSLLSLREHNCPWASSVLFKPSSPEACCPPTSKRSSIMRWSSRSPRTTTPSPLLSLA
jgi:hypothetical protein